MTHGESENHATHEPLKKSGLKRWIRALTLLYGLGLILGLLQVISGRDPGADAGGKKFSLLNKIKPKAPAVAVLPISGPISAGEKGDLMGGHSADKICRRLKALSEMDDVKAVVLRINSPGGSVGAVQEIYEQIVQFKKSGKKVVVSMGDVAASGGYYIAAAADGIVASPGTITGSIGVIFQVGNFQELFKKIGVKMDAVKSAEHKDMGSPFRTMTEKEKKILQALIDDAYGQFVDAIVSGRGMDRGKVLKLADGRIFTGAQAKAEGLVDELGNLDSAVAKAAALAGIQEKPRVLYEEEKWERLFSMLAQSAGLGSYSSLDEAASRLGVRFSYLWEYSL